MKTKPTLKVVRLGADFSQADTWHLTLDAAGTLRGSLETQDEIGKQVEIDSPDNTPILQLEYCSHLESPVIILSTEEGVYFSYRIEMKRDKAIVTNCCKIEFPTSDIMRIYPHNEILIAQTYAGEFYWVSLRAPKVVSKIAMDRITQELFYWSIPRHGCSLLNSEVAVFLSTRMGPEFTTNFKDATNYKSPLIGFDRLSVLISGGTTLAGKIRGNMCLNGNSIYYSPTADLSNPRPIPGTYKFVYSALAGFFALSEGQDGLKLVELFPSPSVRTVKIREIAPVPAHTISCTSGPGFISMLNEDGRVTAFRYDYGVYDDPSVSRNLIELGKISMFEQQNSQEIDARLEFMSRFWKPCEIQLQNSTAEVPQSLLAV